MTSRLPCALILLGIRGIKEQGALKFNENLLRNFCERKEDIVKHRIRWGGVSKEEEISDGQKSEDSLQVEKEQWALNYTEGFCR